MTLTLSDSEHELVVRILQRYATDLRMEILHTDRRELKAALRADERVLEELIQRLPGLAGRR